MHALCSCPLASVTIPPIVEQDPADIEKYGGDGLVSP
jgi:hypothetical protein